MTTAKCPKSLSALLTFCKSPYRAAMLPIAKVIFTQFFSECSNSEPRTFKSWGNRANHQTGGNRLGPDMANVSLSLWQNFHQINVYCLLGSFCLSSKLSHKQHHRLFGYWAPISFLWIFSAVKRSLTERQHYKKWFQRWMLKSKPWSTSDYTNT